MNVKFNASPRTHSLGFLALLRAYVGSILFLLYMVLYTPIHAVLMLFTAPFATQPFQYRFACIWMKNTINMLKWLCDVHYWVEGLANLPSPDAPAIVIAKHQSAWETLALPLIILPKQLCFVHKRELNWIPFFGWAFSTLRMIGINRSDGKSAFAKISKATGKKLHEGVWMIFFPEGTRVPPGERQRYKTGASRLSIAHKVPLVPIVHNAGCFWPKSGIIKYPGCITVRIGPIIHPENHTAESLMQSAESWIENELVDISKPIST